MNRSEINDFVLARYADYYERLMREIHGEKRDLLLASYRGSLFAAESIAYGLGLGAGLVAIKADIKKEWGE